MTKEEAIALAANWSERGVQVGKCFVIYQTSNGPHDWTLMDGRDFRGIIVSEGPIRFLKDQEINEARALVAGRSA